MTVKPPSPQDPKGNRFPIPDELFRVGRDAAERAMQQLASSQSAAFREFDFTKLIANLMPPDHHAQMLKLQKQAIISLASIAVPKFDFSSLLPKIDIDSLMAPQIDLINSTIKSMLNQFEGLDSILWPSNLHGLSTAERTRLVQLVMEEGIPFAWVPPVDVVRALLTADNAAARRKILVRKKGAIVASCLYVVENASKRGADGHDEYFVRAVLAALDDGHFAPAQALAANHIDTMLKKVFSKKHLERLTSRKVATPTLDDYPPTTALVVGAIWTSHREYRPYLNEKVSREFTRHGTAHAVSRRQYTQANAVIAAMHITSLLRVSVDHPEVIKEVLGEETQ